MNFVDFSGKTFIIIGASSGIGRETAVLINSLGGNVVLVARREQDLGKVQAKLQGSCNLIYPLDVRQIDKIGEMFSTVVKKCGKLDGLVFTAGLGWSIPLKSLELRMSSHLFEVNTFSFFECMKQLSKKTYHNEGTRAVAVSSSAAVIGDSGHTIYSASKAALDAALRCMAKELAPRGICVNSVVPGMINTKMYEDFKLAYGENSTYEQEFLKRQYLGIGEPIDVANTIAFLLSPAARFITGASIPVDGGLLSN